MNDLKKLPTGKHFAHRSGYMMQFACLTCRKVFKQAVPYPPRGPQRNSERACPQCGQPLKRMGVAFKAPRQSDVRGWRKVSLLIQNGFAFHSNTGQYPTSVTELRAYVADRRKRSDGAQLALEIKKRRAYPT
jgi:DNA-directed RNA polymerase subunit RPC12/RpoP